MNRCVLFVSAIVSWCVSQIGIAQYVMENGTPLAPGKITPVGKDTYSILLVGKASPLDIESTDKYSFGLAIEYCSNRNDAMVLKGIGVDGGGASYILTWICVSSGDEWKNLEIGKVLSVSDGFYKTRLKPKNWPLDPHLVFYHATDLANERCKTNSIIKKVMFDVKNGLTIMWRCSPGKFKK